MAKVELGKGRSTINEYPEGVEIIIPTKKNWFVIIFSSFWLLGWFAGESTALAEVFSSNSEAPKAFLIAWLGMWTIGGGVMIFILMYMLKGKEIIRIYGDELQYTKDFVIFKRVKEYELSNIKNLRLNSKKSFFDFNSGLEFWGLSGGAIAFDYGLNTHKFGALLDDAEAKYIIDKITEKFHIIKE